MMSRRQSVTRVAMLFVLALGLGGALLNPATATAQEPAAVMTGKGLVDEHATSVCKFAYNPISYTYIRHEYLGHRALGDGTYVLSYHFHIQGNFKKQYAPFAFHFDKKGNFLFLNAQKGTAVFTPFDVIKSRSDNCREALRQVDTVKNSATLLQQVNASSQQGLCELAIKNGILLK